MSNAEIAGKRGTGDALGVVADQPDRPKPYFKRQFRILEDRPDQNREGIAALGALVAVRFQRVDLIVAAVGAKLAVSPSNGFKVVQGHLIVTEFVIKFCESFELLKHGVTVCALFIALNHTFAMPSSAI